MSLKVLNYDLRKEDTMNKYFKIITLLMLITVFLSCDAFKSIFGSNDRNDADSLYWHEVESPTTQHLNSVYFVSEDNGWAVGAHGTIIHYDGSRWNLVESPTVASLQAVHFISSTDGWAVGESGVILHYDGTNWQNVSVFDSPHYWRSIYFASPTNGWISGGVAGGLAKILHYDGVNWATEYEGKYGISALSFISADEGWCVGYGTLHYLNGTWSVVDTVHTKFNDACFLSSTCGWATASPAKSGPNSAQTWHYDGTDWNLVGNPAPDDSQGLGGIYFIDENDGWTVGWRSQDKGYIMHFDGISWTFADSAIGDGLISIYFLDSHNGWAVGYSGTIVHYSP
jgi:photosystem II stability/assembly factor-like uncharacterized protein